MQTFTLGLGVWLRRLVSRSALVRVSDRVEAVTLVLVAAACLLMAPIAGAVGTAEYDRLARTYAAQRLSHRDVEAVAVHDSRLAPTPRQLPYLTEVLVALGLWSGVSGVVVAAWLLLRIRLDRARFAAWDRELDDLADNGGRTNAQ